MELVVASDETDQESVVVWPAVMLDGLTLNELIVGIEIVGLDAATGTNDVGLAVHAVDRQKQAGGYRSLTPCGICMFNCIRPTRPGVNRESRSGALRPLIVPL